MATAFKTIYQTNRNVFNTVSSVYPQYVSQILGNRDYMLFLKAIADGAAYCTIDINADDVPYKTPGFGNIALDSEFPREPTDDMTHDKMYAAMQDGLSIHWADKHGLLEATGTFEPIVFKLDVVRDTVKRYEESIDFINKELQTAEVQYNEVQAHGKDTAMKRLSALGARTDYVHMF